MRARLLLGFLSLLAALPASGQSRLAFDTEEANLGRIVEGEVARHTFRFRNTGTEAARIDRVDTSCGCTTPSYTRGSVEPNRTGEVEVAYDSRGRPGPFERTVYVVPEGSLVGTTLRVTGLVVPAFAARGVAIGALTFDTDRLDVGAVLPTAPLQVPFRFVNTSDRPIHIISVDAPDGVEVVYPPRPVFGGSVAGLFVMIDDPASVAGDDGRLDVELSLHTSDTGLSTKRVRLLGFVQPASGGE